jgi:hypothetical protein
VIFYYFFSFWYSRIQRNFFSKKTPEQVTAVSRAQQHTIKITTKSEAVSFVVAILKVNETCAFISVYYDGGFVLK